ncbi:sensor domain-containing protein [Roseomonas elaeocarpi]|uniref:Sensor domain-containing protein n=1 Tax=Roseomonas elaeocarpi TaxID=907779 RepID=A0ABV6JTX0_9PROT
MPVTTAPPREAQSCSDPRWQDRTVVDAAPPDATPARWSVGFLYNAQAHHILHSLPLACALSRHAEVAVTVMSPSATHLALAERLAGYYPGHRLRFQRLRAPPGLARSKAVVLLLNATTLARFDALVLPERTSLLLRRLGVRHPKLIHSFHGASGHDRAGDPRLAQFDLLLAPSAQRLERIAAAGIRPRAAAVTGYNKLDLIRRMGTDRPQLFPNSAPVVLYNPHHRPATSSWPLVGRQVLDHFAAQRERNLVFAPHIRLFDPPAAYRSTFRRYEGLEQLRIDLGSTASIDMTYTLGADLYLGDISSQVTEFLIRPRPCVFLNPRGIDWQGRPDFAAWQLGRVVRTLPEMVDAIRTADEWQAEFAERQREAFAEAFPEGEVPAPVQGAEAILKLLRGER